MSYRPRLWSTCVVLYIFYDLSVCNWPPRCFPRSAAVTHFFIAALVVNSVGFVLDIAIMISSGSGTLVNDKPRHRMPGASL